MELDKSQIKSRAVRFFAQPRSGFTVPDLFISASLPQPIVFFRARQLLDDFMCDVFASYSPILTEQTEDGKFAAIFSNSTRGASLCTGIVYQADEASLARYMSLRKIVQDRLDAPFSIEDANHVTRHSAGAMRAYAAVMLSDTVAECKYASASILLAIEYLIYLANKSYLRRGIRRIPEELRTMKRLPPIECYFPLLEELSHNRIKGLFHSVSVDRLDL